ncbi:D-tyrosyl-tRNA(Tyr) deacylase [Sphingobacteriales bacterium UPWRP_1]|nr:D-tyrosyl-tRNA(Tyr) deacylase [Sphingobacteriales bacterium TSM_CSS]PSJ73263.1 D-tyrosyl-tRNA(Tyr) deacylase [Sphingobacteriales bacterium UPWRP_1]
MKAVIQRVSSASVAVEGAVKSAIGAGLLILLGIENADGTEDIEWLAAKIINLRIFNDENGLMNLSVQDINGQLLVVSQFTLHASTKKGNRPSFIAAARPETAIPLYEQFVQTAQNLLDKPVLTGEFGAYMQVELCNDGPVTIVIDTKNKV